MAIIHPTSHISIYKCRLLISVLSLLMTAPFVMWSRLHAAVCDSIRYDASLHITLSSGQNTPLWLVSNMQGLGSPKRNFGFARAGAFKDIDSTKRFSWGVGIDLVGAWRSSASFHIQQLYGEMNYRSIRIIIGSKELWCSHNDPKLSSGSLLFSGNALPIPQVRVGIVNYAPFWGTMNWLNVKGYLSYGIFSDSKWQQSWTATNSKYNKNMLFHSKGLWLRGGNTEYFPILADVGIEMATQFGGTAYHDGKMVHMKIGFKEWWRAFFPTYSTQETLLGQLSSVEGNMVGQYTIGLQWLPKDKDWNIRAYFEHYFEDQSMMTFEYGWKDGLWGLEGTLPKNCFVSKIVYEFLYSKDQAGAVNNDASDKVPEQVSGRDNYYNHSLYSGWQHWGLGIGNPLMISPIYNADHNLIFYTTRIIGHHFAIAGKPSKELDYRLILSHTLNWGTYSHPLPEVMNNLNGLLELNWHPQKLNGWYGGITLAFDSGNLLGKSFGVGLTIGKNGFIHF